MFEAGRVYDRHRDTHGPYGDFWKSGIAPSGNWPLIFLFSVQSGARYGYEKDWDENGGFLKARNPSSRRTSEANEGSLAHLLGQSVGVVAHPGLGSLGEKVRLAQPHPQPLEPLAVYLDRRRPLGLVAGDEPLR